MQTLLLDRSDGQQRPLFNFVMNTSATKFILELTRSNEQKIFSTLVFILISCCASSKLKAESVATAGNGINATDFNVHLKKPSLFKTKMKLFRWEVQSHQLRVTALAREVIKEPDVLNKMPQVKKLVNVFGEDKIVKFMERHDYEKLYDEVLDYLTRQKGIHIESQKEPLRSELLKTRDRFNQLEHELSATARKVSGIVPDSRISQQEIDEALGTIEKWADWKDRHLNPDNAKEFNKVMKSPSAYADEYLKIQADRGIIVPKKEIKIFENVKKIEKIIDEKPGFYSKATSGLEARTYTANKIKAMPMIQRAPFFAAMKPVVGKLGAIGTVYSIGEWMYSGRDLGEQITQMSMGLISETGREDLSEEEQLDSYNWILNKSFDDRLRWSCHIPNSAKIQLKAACIKDISCSSEKSLKIELESLEDLQNKTPTNSASTNVLRTFKMDFTNESIPAFNDVQISEVKIEKSSGETPPLATWSLQKSLRSEKPKNRLPADPDLRFLVNIKEPLKTCCRRSMKSNGKVKSCLQTLQEKDAKFHEEALQKQVTKPSHQRHIR